MAHHGVQGGTTEGPSSSGSPLESELRSQKPAATPPPVVRPMVQGLPPELLDMIFEHLDTEDVVAARVTCSVSAAVGLDHLVGEVALVYERSKFHALAELANHPVLAKEVESLFF